jgi:HK97 family phage major capsid protein
MSIQNLQIQYRALLTQANALATAGFKDSEQRSQFDQMIADSDKLYQLIEREERSISAQPKFTSPAIPRDGFNSNTDVNKEHEKRAFYQWARTGSSVGYEQRDLGVGTPSAPITGGNVLVPTTISNTFVQARKSYGTLLDFVNSFRTAAGNPVTVPMANDTSNGLVLVGQAQSSNTETDPTLSSVVSNTDTATSDVVKISNELLQDSYFDVAAWLDEVLATRFRRGASNWISTGNTSNVVALGFSGGVTSAASGAVGYPDLAALFGSVDAAYANSPTAAFIMSSKTRAGLMGLVSTTGQPILQQDPVSGDPFGMIFGKRIAIDENRPTIAAGNVPILFGDVNQQYSFRYAGDFIIKRLDELFALNNETAFVLYCRVSGVNTDAGTHPVAGLTIHS